MENFDQKPIFRCLICNGHFGTLEENEYGLWGHIIDPEEAGQAARAAEQNGMQSGSNTEMSPFYYGGTTFSECFRDFLDTVEDYNYQNAVYLYGISGYIHAGTTTYRRSISDGCFNSE